jgi:hypothetical protein
MPYSQKPAQKAAGGPSLSETEVSAWKSRLGAAKDALKPVITKGKKNISRLVNEGLELRPAMDTIEVPLDFAYTYQKAALLFPETPEVIGEALQPTYEPAAPIYTAVANHMLGKRGVKADAMLEEIATDLLCGVGFAVTKVGYENVIDGVKPVPTGQMIPDPNAPLPLPVEQPGAILGLSQPPMPEPAMIPETVPMPNVVCETYYWRRIPPGRFRRPIDFMGSDFDDAAWLAWRFKEDVLDDEDTGSRTRRGSTDDDEMLLSPPHEGTGSAQPKVRWGHEVWYKASLFDQDAKHPDLIRTFTIYDDDDGTAPVEKRDSPNQRWAVADQPLSETYVPGATLVGMKGFPLVIWTLRYVSDRAIPPSDSTMARQTIDQVSKGHTQVLQKRDRSLTQVGYDATRVLPDQLAKIERNENMGYVGFNGPVEGAFVVLDKGTSGRETFLFDEMGQKTLDMIYAMGSNAGVMSGGSETATKSNQIQQAIQSRARKERSRIDAIFASGVEKLMGLVQIYADQEDYVRIVGTDGAARLVPWNKDSISGPWALKVRPNSQARVDEGERGRMLLQGYNQLRKDPNVEPRELIKPLAAHMGYDPERLWKDSPPPEPEKPSVSYAIKIEDFVGPGAGIAAHLTAAAGWPIPPEVLQTAQTLGAVVAAQKAQQAQAAEAQKQQQKGSRPGPEHGGQAEQSEPINKHQMDLTGGVQGVPTPDGPVM